MVDLDNILIIKDGYVLEEGIVIFSGIELEGGFNYFVFVLSYTIFIFRKL